MRFIPIFAIAILFFGCGKDKFTTIPQLKYKSVNKKTISGSETLVFKLELTDKEGDFTTLLGVKKVVPGCPSTPTGPPGSEFTDSLKFLIPPDFINTKGTHGEVIVTLDQNDRGSNACNMPGGTKPDTTVFKFWTRDKAGHTSDTAVSEQIIILN